MTDDARWTFQYVYGGRIMSAADWEKVEPGIGTDPQSPNPRANVLLVAIEDLGLAPELLLFVDPAVDIDESLWSDVLRWCASYKAGANEGWQPFPPIGRYVPIASVTLDDPFA